MMKVYTKNERCHLLKEIISNCEIRDQVHLLHELEKYNVEVTQATISRDLQEMGVIKVRAESGVYKYAILEKSSKPYLWDQIKILFKNFVIEIKGVNNLLLIKTAPGNANSVASLIDNMERKEILGTVAGDDTILMVIDTDKNRKTVEKELRDLLENLSRI